ncbi:hypothetical protein KY290_021924 [Solanum tuberosum]|uniref:Uncharacterized protein n=1 Tax=Solanum tuberosum TaxID=4113 RepID=A0ABQ7V2Y9_SOLTU|nr:hypothetical protein KY290_021924 [Solanum tuberosum]
MIPSLCYFIQQKGLDKIEDLESRVEVLNLEEAINTLKGRRSKATRALYLLHDYLQEDSEQISEEEKKEKNKEKDLPNEEARLL